MYCLGVSSAYKDKYIASIYGYKSFIRNKSLDQIVLEIKGEGEGEKESVHPEVITTSHDRLLLWA